MQIPTECPREAFLENWHILIKIIPIKGTVKITETRLQYPLLSITSPRMMVNQANKYIALLVYVFIIKNTARLGDQSLVGYLGPRPIACAIRRWRRELQIIVISSAHTILALIIW